MKGLQDYLVVLQRRRKLILLTSVGLFALSLAVAVLFPPTYKSTATILIEEQEISPDLVRSTMTSFADQRIEIIKQQVMSRASLWKVVEQYDLYSNIRRTSPTEDVLKRFIKDIEVEVVSADVVDKRTQHSTKATIAFTVSYNSHLPELAQKVANELTSLFLGKNLKSRERQAQEATAFLQQEAEHLTKHLEEVEAKIAEFKQYAGGALPELMTSNLQLMNQADRELMDADQQIRSLEERMAYFEGELATIKPNTPIMSATGERILNSAERLKVLRAEYTSASANLASDHPDIIKMKQEIEALEKETGHSPEIEEISKRLSDARTTLPTLAKRLGNDHPDVIQSRRIVASLEKEIRRIGSVPLSKPAQKPENPAYIIIQSQLASVNASLEALRTTRAAVKGRVQEYARRLEQTPEIEPEYLALTRDRDTSAQKYQDIRSRLMEAKVSEGLEVQRMGERFTLIDPPSLPEKPEQPNRPAIALLGFILAVAGGFGAGAAAENLDHSIRTPEQLFRLTQTLPLAVISFMPNEEDLVRALNRRKMIRGASVGVVAVLLIVGHFFWIPLDVLWYATLRKFGLD